MLKWNVFIWGMWLVLLWPALGNAKPLTLRAQHCISSAAAHHGINPVLLQAIIRHESRGNPQTVVRNKNGSIDVGLAGINSINFSHLRQHGVTPESLLDECVSAYVGAWMLSAKTRKYGNTWQAVGAYNSETPYYNQRYQKLIFNELIGMGVSLIPATN
jgi:soluble lytic murein transglycosylase-like protein